MLNMKYLENMKTLENLHFRVEATPSIIDILKREFVSETDNKRLIS